MPSALFVTTVDITLEAFLLPFAARLRAEGWSVDACANGAAENARIAGSFDRRFDASWRRSPLHPGNVRAGAQLRRLVLREGYDIVHVHTPVAAFVARFALSTLSRRVRPVVIYTAHGFHFFEGGAPLTNAAYRMFERSAARDTDLLVTINTEDFDAARGFGAIDAERVELIPGIGVDCDRYHPGAATADERARIREGLGVSDCDFMITMIAEFAPVKRHDFALAALEACGRDDVVLCLVGEGPNESRVRELVRTHGLDGRVRFAGYRRDIPALLSSSDALLLCSVREGLARSVLEAMASAIPVLGTDTRGIADAVSPECGWITPKNDAEALASSMAFAASDREEARRRGAAGRVRACAEYSIGRVLAAHDALYDDALQLLTTRRRMKR